MSIQETILNLVVAFGIGIGAMSALLCMLNLFAIRDALDTSAGTLRRILEELERR